VGNLPVREPAQRGLEVIPVGLVGPVVLVGPEAFGEGIEGAVDRQVVMTRAAQQLVILTSS
jgi:hypothetical protein